MTKTDTQAFDWNTATSSQAAILASANGNFVQALATATQTYIDGVGVLTKELTEFVTARLEHDMEYGQSIAGCKDWNELAEVQQKWASQAGDEYMAQAQKIVELGMNLATNGTGGNGQKGNGQAAKSGT